MSKAAIAIMQKSEKGLKQCEVQFYLAPRETLISPSDPGSCFQNWGLLCINLNQGPGKLDVFQSDFTQRILKLGANVPYMSQHKLKQTW